MSYGDSITEIVYHVAGVGIKYDLEEKSQLFNLEHKEEITSCAVHPEGHTVATGELGKNPNIVLWDSNSGSTLMTMKGYHKRGVSLLTFSDDGKLLYSVGMDDDHSIAVYSSEGSHTNLGQLIAKAKGSRSKMLAIAGFESNSFCLSGKSEVKFFSVNVVKGELSSKKGLFGKKAKNKVCVSCCYLGPDAVTGQADGSLYLWKGRNASIVRKSHSKAVNSLRKCRDGLVSGGKDGKVIVWSESLSAIKTIELKDLSPSVRPLSSDVKSVASMGNKILVGTASSDIIEIDIPTEEARNLLNGHYTGELWGLDSNPTTSNVATVGDDGELCVWDSKKHQRIAHTNCGGKARSIAYMGDGSVIAVGMYIGSVVVYSESDLTKKADVKVAKEWIQTMKFSPDNATLAVGSHDNNIYLLETRTYTRRSVLKGHSSFITHIDWSNDNKFLQSNCGAYELLFWNSKNGRQIKSPSSLKDVSWNTWTCVLGWPVQTIWQGASGNDINSCVRVGGNLVTGGDDGLVKLWRYPVVADKAKSKAYKGHSSHVTNVRESDAGRHLFSVGGMDKAVLQFKII